MKKRNGKYYFASGLAIFCVQNAKTADDQVGNHGWSNDCCLFSNISVPILWRWCGICCLECWRTLLNVLRFGDDMLGMLWSWTECSLCETNKMNWIEFSWFDCMGFVEEPNTYQSTSISCWSFGCRIVGNIVWNDPAFGELSGRSGKTWLT